MRYYVIGAFTIMAFLNGEPGKVHRETDGRSEIDPLFKAVLDFSFRKLGIPLKTQVEVSRLPRTIDVMLILDKESDLEKVRSETPFYYARTHNQIEFKGISDPLTIPGFRLILGRANLYMGENEIPAEQMTITIICSRKPRKVLRSESEVDFSPLGEGYYQSTNNPPVKLIVINELETTSKNYPLLMFASSKKKFKEFLLDTVKNNCFDAYVEFAYRVNPQVTKEVIEMARYGLSKEKLEFIVNDIGQKLLPLFPKEELLKHLTVEDRLANLTAEERLAGLTADELRKRLKELEDKEKNTRYREE
jgi:hypothetical protein